MLRHRAYDALRADFRAHYGLDLPTVIKEDLRVAADLAANLPPDKTSAAYRKLNPETWMWGVSEHLMAHQLDVLRWLQWSKTKDASKKSPRGAPKPIPRPGMKEQQAEAEGRFKGVESLELDELKRRLALPREEVQD